MLERLISIGFKKFGRIADDGSYYLKQVTCSNNSWNASKGARAQCVRYGGMTDNYATHDKPAGQIITNFVKMNADNTVNHYIRRFANNSPQGSSGSVLKGAAGDNYLKQVYNWFA